MMQTGSEKVTKMVQLVEAESLPMQDASNIKKAFLHLFDQAEEWERRAKELVVTDASQIREMQMARQARLAMRDIRLQAKKTKDELKENSLRYARAVQGVFNLILHLVEPIETYLEDQEKFAERQRERERAALHEERYQSLAPYAEFVALNIDFGVMTEQHYQTVVAGAKAQAEAKAEALRKAEQERIEREQAAAAEQRRIAEENKRLREENERAQAALKAEQDARAKIEAERAAEQAAIRAREADLQAAEAAKRKAEEDAKRAEENRAIAERKAKEAAARKAAAAPDKEKLLILAKAVLIDMPEMATPEGSEIITHVKHNLRQLSEAITRKANAL